MLFLAISCCFAAPVAAQTTTPTTTASSGLPPGLVTTPDRCVVVAHDEGDGSSTLSANCRGQGLILGRATQYDVRANEALGAWILDMHLGTNRQVWLLTLRDAGPPLLEDLNGQIARTAGKSLMSNIAEVDIDFAGFARDGSIGIRTASVGAAGGRTVQLPLNQQIARERSR